MGPDAAKYFKRIGIVGAGNMGTMMSFGFAEQGVDVSLWDISGTNVNRALQMAKDARKEEKTVIGKIDCFCDIHEFTESLNDSNPAVYIFSITHGDPADSILKMIKDDLRAGDIILDGGNEHYRNTERRQRELEKKGVHWVGMGVSGGYQSARRGPSMSPGGTKDAVEKVLPLLEKFAAKDRRNSKPCVAYIGPYGAGHYVKMVHNGIENGMLSTISEAWSMMHKSLGMPFDEISRVFERWNSKGELRSTFLVQIGSEICLKKKTPEGDQRGEGAGRFGFVLDDVLDKVVQDVDNTEGTLYWTVSESAFRHVAAPTIATGHFIRVASGNRDQRLRVAEKLNIPGPHKANDVRDKEALLEDLQRAVYASFLCSFCQGLELIARASKDEGWDINLGTCIRIWRAGCIIQAEHILDLFETVFSSSSGQSQPIMNMKLIDEISSDLHKNFQPLKKIVLKAMEWDNCVPSMSASLEYIKYEGGTMLPTQFMEAEMDYFGAHAYDKPNVKNEDPGEPNKGAHHYEWKPA
ncbi:6-phosphogluconate dehydrogenase C-terminal domain-like protein [Lepidopterella palustris CBS 459.81]|uniref:6-phosphogluconate dehydrogenase, decarboxylating n=1 Tax=Lepidopterella palustris CBS 459.81 TaxID=1314670 RepID=A0A8E2J8Q6_9PEZI|nr:6-phosphogluconate dehydrogenase C-terminal domain-like protein [Lepidopterella palustris CBS 459.81]